MGAIGRNERRATPLCQKSLNGGGIGTQKMVGERQSKLLSVYYTVTSGATAGGREGKAESVSDNMHWPNNGKKRQLRTVKVKVQWETKGDHMNTIAVKSQIK